MTQSGFQDYLFSLTLKVKFFRKDISHQLKCRSILRLREWLRTRTAFSQIQLSCLPKNLRNMAVFNSCHLKKKLNSKFRRLESKKPGQNYEKNKSWSSQTILKAATTKTKASKKQLVEMTTDSTSGQKSRKRLVIFLLVLEDS